MKRALIITGDLVQDHEFIYPYYRLQEAGYEVHVAAKDGSQKEIKGIIGTKIPVNRNFEGMKRCEERDGYDLLVIPGGAKCMEKLRQEKEVLDFIRDFDKKGKIIASICHGAQLLISARVVKDRTIAGYYSIKDDIKNAGAEYCDTYLRYNNIISASHYKYMPQWMKQTIEAFE